MGRCRGDELPEHPWFLAVQFHPDSNRSTRSRSPLFAGFIARAVAHSSGNKAGGRRVSRASRRQMLAQVPVGRRRSGQA